MPEKFSPAQTTAAVAAARDEADLWMVMQKQWTFQAAFKYLEEAAAYGLSLADRFEPQDVSIRADDFGGRHQVSVLEWTAVGTFREEARAHEVAERNVLHESVVVKRNSRAMHELKQYGVRKLAKAE